MGDREKSISRPFYELPAHIKPCSRIIQETRMQLQYSKNIGNEIPNNSSSIGCGPSGDFIGNDYFGNCELPEIENSFSSSRPSLGFGGMRPVNTQRPFTPRDSVSLWGVSARKRPPSAITLSRLSIEEVDESNNTPTSSFTSNNGSSTPSAGRLKKPLVPKSSLGTLPNHISLPETRNIVGSPSDYINSSPKSTDESSIEKTRLKIKSLSLQNVTSLPSRTTAVQIMHPMSVLGSIKRDEADERGMSGKKSRYSTYDDTSTTTTTTTTNLDNKEEMARKRMNRNDTINTSNTKIAISSESSEVNDIKSDDRKNTDSYQEINNLEVAIEYLRCFVIESASKEKPQKSDVISILKKIRGHFLDSEMIPSLKKQLLQLIFKLVERNQTDEDILFWSSFVLLHCNIIGNNLTTIFKMIFKSSRSKDYKEIIKNTEYLSVLMKSFSQICPKTQTESMIYGYGTLKFICTDNFVLNSVIDLDLIPIMALHLKILNCEIAEMGKIPEPIFNGTFQLTSILRSVVGEERSLISVVQSGLLDELCSTLVWTMDDIDVLTNIVRILSVVSMDSMCCQVIHNNDCFCGAVVGVLKHWYAKDDVMVRLAYCLGNLLANSDDMRVKFYEEPEAFQCILKVLSHYIEKSTPNSMDILVKTTRILANWILNPFVGSEICDDPYLSELMYSTLQIPDISNELVLCAMCALNNTSFYKNYQELDEGTCKTVEYLYKNLGMKDLEARTEAVKVLGNLTRNKGVRLLAIDYMENILLSLEEILEELLCATCGVLINVIIEEKVQPEFLRKKGVERIIRVLERTNDTSISLMASQVIWNLLISNEHLGTDINQYISQERKSDLKRILVEKLKRSSKETFELKEDIDNDEEARSEVISEDFETVARDLIAKL